MRERGARAGAVRKAHLTATTAHDSKDGHPHPPWGLPTVGVRLQMEVDPRWEQVVQRWYVRGARRRRPLLRPTRRRAVRPEVGPLGELAVEAPARRCEVRNGVHAHTKAGAGQRWGAGRKY